MSPVQIQFDVMSLAWLAIKLTVCVLVAAWLVIQGARLLTAPLGQSASKFALLAALLIAASVAWLFVRGSANHFSIPQVATVRTEPTRAAFPIRRAPRATTGNSQTAEVASPPDSESQATDEPESTASVNLAATSPLPAWTQQNSLAEDGHLFVVVSSGRFATREEAGEQALAAAAVKAAEHFRQLDPRGVGEMSPFQIALLQELGVKQRFEEVVQTDFGKFTAPMYQIWLQLDFTPKLGERLTEQWRVSAVESRLRTLGGWGAWLTAMFAAVAIALRLDAVWNGRGRLVVCLATILLAAGGLVFVV